MDEIATNTLYTIEIALRLTPFPLSVQRKELANAKSLYNQIKESMTQGHPTILELTCEQLADKKISILTSEILAVQMYEKTSSGGGNKRPGFSIED
tara:strand:- start:779 stop:1066 length:288 start_codon:yes stop_codon:yes gene_type:complete